MGVVFLAPQKIRETYYPNNIGDYDPKNIGDQSYEELVYKESISSIRGFIFLSNASWIPELINRVMIAQPASPGYIAF